MKQRAQIGQAAQNASGYCWLSTSSALFPVLPPASLSRASGVKSQDDWDCFRRRLSSASCSSHGAFPTSHKGFKLGAPK